MRTKVSSHRRLWTILLAMCVMLTLPLSAEAQKVSLKLKDATVQQAIQSLQKQGYSISVKLSDVNMNAAVSIDAKDEELSAVLGKIFAGQNVETTVDGKSIIVTKRVAAAASTPARTTTVTGQVKDAAGNPLIGVTVWVEGTTTGTTTDMAGNYSITAKNNQTLGFSYIGYTDMMEAVGSRSVINVVLKEAATSMDEVVVVGYGTQSRRTLTTAVSKIDGAELFDAPVSNVGDALKGKVAGLRVQTADVASGAAPRFLVRGGSSINMSNDPIVIVDGVLRTMDDINPNDIESIEILKDAASAGIYGARASNGVVLITTKKGAIGQGPQIVFDAQVGWSEASRKWDLMNAKEFLAWVRPALKDTRSGETFLAGANAAGTGNTLGTSMFTTRYLTEGEEVAPGWDWMVDPIDPTKYLTFRDTDYQSQWYSPALWHKEYVGVNGGNDKIRYAASVSYLADDGYIAGTGYNVFTMHGNTTFKISKRLEASTTFDLSRSVRQVPFSDYFTSIGRGLMMGPTTRNFDDEGNYITGGTNKFQQIAWFYENFFDREAATTRMTGNFNLKWNICDGLTATAQYAIFDNQYRGSYYNRGEFEGHKNFVYADRSTTETRTQTLRNTFQAYLNYNKTFNDLHTINATAGYDYMHQRYWYLTANATGSVSDKVPILDSGVNFTASNEDESQALISYFGRVNYDYKGKYLLEANVRYDGSSMFPEGKKFGLFPSFSAGWRIIEEPWMEFAKPYVSTLKARVSWGSVGDQSVSSSLYIPTISTGQNEWITANNTLANYAGTPSTVSAGITWQRIETLDVGVDARMFNSHVGVTFDWFQRDTDQMIVPTDGVNTVTFGASAPKANNGSLRTTGWELAIDGNYRFANGLGINGTFMIADAKSTIMKYGDTKSLSSWYVGKRYGEIWGFQVDRLYQYDDFELDENGSLIYRMLTEDDTNDPRCVGKYAYILKKGPNGEKPVYQAYYQGGSFLFGPGDVKYKDVDGDGILSYGTKTTDDHGDWSIIGDETPRYEYSFRLGADWHGVDVSVFFQGVGKREMWGNGPLAIPGWDTGDGAMANAFAADYWTPENTDAFYPAAYGMGKSNDGYNVMVNDRYILNMAYLRLKNLTVGYTLPEKWTKKAQIQNLRIYFTGENLLTFDKLRGLPIDPECVTGVSMWGSNYAQGRTGLNTPVFKTVSVGIQATF